MREGATKVSDHWVRSPLLNVSRACQVCHPYDEAEIQARVAAIQERTHALLERAATANVAMLDAIVAAKAAMKKGGASADGLAPALELQRKAQWRLDFISSRDSCPLFVSTRIVASTTAGSPPNRLRCSL